MASIVAAEKAGAEKAPTNRPVAPMIRLVCRRALNMDESIVFPD
jgi:hypothetical protein